jgi:hypothetical protein
MASRYKSRNPDPSWTLNVGGARLCPDHNGRPECTKYRSKDRGLCHQLATRGTDACKNHSGMSLAAQKAKGEATISAWKASGGATIDYRMAVLGVLQMTWMRLGAYSELLRQQVVSQGAEADPDGLSRDGDAKSSGLIGHRYGAAGKDGHIYAQSEEVRALVQLESAERDRVVKYAHDMGISERLTSMAERWGDLVAGRITALLADLQLTPEQNSQVPALLERHLGSIDVESIGGPKT